MTEFLSNMDNTRKSEPRIHECDLMQFQLFNYVALCILDPTIPAPGKEHITVGYLRFIFLYPSVFEEMDLMRVYVVRFLLQRFFSDIPRHNSPSSTSNNL